MKIDLTWGPGYRIFWSKDLSLDLALTHLHPGTKAFAGHLQTEVDVLWTKDKLYVREEEVGTRYFYFRAVLVPGGVSLQGFTPWWSVSAHLDRSWAWVSEDGVSPVEALNKALSTVEWLWSQVALPGTMRRDLEETVLLAKGLRPPEFWEGLTYWPEYSQEAESLLALSSEE